MHTSMKTKYVYVTTTILCIFVLLVVFKLNDYYKIEKMQNIKAEIQQKNLSLKTSVSTQVNQLKNVLSSYTYQIDENKLNWMQLEPLTVIAQSHISNTGKIEVKNIFTKSGSRTERWTKDFLQKALELKKYSRKSIQADLFQTKSGDKYLALTFAQNSNMQSLETDAITVVGDANYFQKFFDLNRSKKTTSLLITDANIVAGHSESEYVAATSTEGKISERLYFVETDELRSTNLKIISYSSKSSVLSFLNIPMMLLGLILGFVCILIGVLFFAFRPIEKILLAQRKSEKEALYKQTLADEAKVLEPQRSITNHSDQKPTIAKPELKLQLRDDVSNRESPTANQNTTEKSDALVLPANFQFEPNHVAVSALNSLASVLEEVLFQMKPLLVAENIQLKQNLTSQSQLDFDSLRFKKLFEHLIKNAIEAVRDSAEKIISVKAYDQNGQTVVEIEDSGAGVSEEIMEKIWHPYFTTKAKSKHQGLGLSEAISIARRYGGDLVLVNRPAGGAVFKLTMMGIGMEKTDSETNVQTTEMSKKIDEINIDQILNFDDEDSDIELSNNEVTTKTVQAATQAASSPVLDLENEFRTKKFKLDRDVLIVENPTIDFIQNENPMEQFAVQIRKPSREPSKS